MRATGIVRRIDDLGCVVIPREIRKSCGIKDGDPLEIFVDYDGSVLFKKYNIPIESEIDSLRERIEYVTGHYHPKIHQKLNEVKALLKEYEENR